MTIQDLIPILDREADSFNRFLFGAKMIGCFTFSVSIIFGFILLCLGAPGWVVFLGSVVLWVISYNSIKGQI